MKAPSEIDALSLAGEDAGSGGAYPSLGFRAVWDAELGNGDYFGLYWPYGREDREPIVCDMLHDEWSLVVAFSNAGTFVKWVKLNDGCRGASGRRSWICRSTIPGREASLAGTA
ncbi:MAG: hypothetical protein WCJ09_14740 [Planctomycetota bacterium]